jgi:3,4-dihydroxy 2-butanone 4-phosphate synthase/GTP cyclohydrolase II
VDEHSISSRLSTHDMPDPDLIIRTSGEQRLSNFLIWQAAYAEYWTTPLLWPEFGPQHLRQAVLDYGARSRRFGGPDEAREEPLAFASIDQALADFRDGKLVLILDDEERENEGDLAIAAQHATPQAIAFLATHARGLICMPMDGRRLDELGIPLMVPLRQGNGDTAFTVSVDARSGISSGISAFDRARTVEVLLSPEATLADIVMPGHLFPLRYTEGGVLRRPGHTEASVDLARLAGLYPAAVICEMMAADGTMARRPQLGAFAREHRISTITVRQLIEHVKRISSEAVPRNGTVAAATHR